MRRPHKTWFCGILVLFCATCSGQQIPFISITGPGAPKGAAFLLEDSVRGGLWLGGVTESAAGLTYFDGSRFISPLRDPFPKAVVTGMAEDREGGIWLATDVGLYRAFRGHLERLADGNAARGIVQAGPELLVATVTKKGAQAAALLRISKVGNGTWRVDTILPSTGQTRFQADRDGHILFGCPDGYCEFRAADIANWHAGTPLPVIRHTAPQWKNARFQDSIVLRDHFGCVWRRDSNEFNYHTEIAYQCPGDLGASDPAENANIVGPGPAAISEAEDGSIVIPSFGKLAIGRPGHFRIYTVLEGVSGGVNAVVRKDGIWLSSGNGLFVMPTRLRMEFWTERDGLEGIIGSILQASGKTFAVAGESLLVLGRDRRHWSRSPINQSIARIFPGPNGTVAARTAEGQIIQINSEGKVIGELQSTDELLSNESSKSDPGRQTCTAVFEHDGADQAQIKEGLPHQGCIPFEIGGKRDILRAIGGMGGGLALLEDWKGAHPRDRRFAGGGEIGATTVRFLGVDGHGWIWRGSPIGIYVADTDGVRQGRWLYLNGLDGISGTDADTGSFFDDSDGSVWFGVDNSINHLYPSDDLLYPRESPDIFISGYSLNGGEIQMAETIHQIKGGGSVTALVGSMELYRRNALRLRYRLLPGQSAWRESSSLDLALGRLSSGPHTLEVQGRILNGPWSGTVRQSFTVLLPVWLTLPLLISYGIAGAGLWATWHFLRRKSIQEERELMPDLRDWRIGALLPEGQEFLGTTLDGRFEVGELLASGGFATVAAGYDKCESRACAIKIFRSDITKSSILHGFEREVAALRQIRHPHVVSIYGDGFTSTGAPYLAMEFIEGKSLRHVLEKGPLPAERVGRLLEQLTAALDAIHLQGICHRDVKPENVIIRHTSISHGARGEQAVLIDFSIAIIKDANESLHGISRAEGTFDYMAPEQALGYAQPASDVFSLAKVVIEMLIGVRVAKLLPNVALDLPIRLAGALKPFKLGLSEESMIILASALDFSPSNRPGVAGEFARPLIRDLKGR